MYKAGSFVSKVNQKKKGIPEYFSSNLQIAIIRPNGHWILISHFYFHTVQSRHIAIVTDLTQHDTCCKNNLTECNL